MVEKKIKVKEVSSHAELPERYVLFQDNLEAAVKRMEQIEGKLLARGIKVVKPYVIFRITTKENVYVHNRKKKSIKVERKPFSELAFRVEKA